MMGFIYRQTNKFFRLSVCLGIMLSITLSNPAIAGRSQVVAGTVIEDDTNSPTRALKSKPILRSLTLGERLKNLFRAMSSCKAPNQVLPCQGEVHESELDIQAPELLEDISVSIHSNPAVVQNPVEHREGDYKARFADLLSISGIS